MATRRKTFTPKEPVRQGQSYAEFMAALLAGTIKASKLIDQVRGGRLELEYDDPNG